MQSPVAGDVAHDAVPRRGTLRRMRPSPDRVLEPLWCFGRQRLRGPCTGHLDGLGEQPSGVGARTKRRDRGRPVVRELIDAVTELRELRRGRWRQRHLRCRVVEDLDLVPSEAALDGHPRRGGKRDIDLQLVRVDGGDGADVAPIDGADLHPDRCSLAGCDGGLVAVLERTDLDPDLVGRDSLKLHRPSRRRYELRIRMALGQRVHGRHIGVAGMRELLPTTAAEPADQILTQLRRLVVEIQTVVVTSGVRLIPVQLERDEFGFGRDDQVLGFAARHRHIGAFAIQPVGADHDRHIPRAALVAMRRRRIPMRQTAVLFPVPRPQTQITTRVRVTHVDRRSPNPGHDPGLAVDDVQPELRVTVVGADRHQLPHPHIDPTKPASLTTHLPRRLQPGQHRCVELVDHLVRRCLQHRRVAVLARSQPTVHRNRHHRLRIDRRRHPTMVKVRINRGRDVTVAQLLQGLDLPVGFLATVDRQFGDLSPIGGGCVCEPAAGGDFGKLMLIPNQDHPAARRDHLVGEVRQRADVGHAGLIDHHDRSRVEAHSAVIQSMQQRVHRRRLDPGALPQLMRGSGRRRRTQDDIARRLVRLPHRIERERLARTGRAHNRLHRRHTTRGHAHRVGLILSDGGPSRDRRVNQLGRDRQTISVLERVQEAALDPHHVMRRIQDPATVLGDLDHAVVAQHRSRNSVHGGGGGAVAEPFRDGLHGLGTIKHRVSQRQLGDHLTDPHVPSDQLT